MRSSAPTLTMLVALILTASARGVSSAPITYDMIDYPELQNGHTLTGTITTDGTLGSIWKFNIVSWEFVVTGPHPFEASSASSATDFSVYDGSIIATSEAIILTGNNILVRFGTPQQPNITFDLYWPHFGYYGTPFEEDYAWATEMYDATKFPFTIATVATEPIPEPSSVTLALVGLLGLGGYATRKRRLRAKKGES